MNTVPLKALFDTGSTITLINSIFKPEILGSLALSAQIAQQPSLCGADGLPLIMAGTYSLPVVISDTHITHPITFINNLQVDALIGMDLMHKCKISIDTNHNQICLFTSSNPSPASTSTLALQKSITFQPMTETKVNFEMPDPLPTS